MKARSLLLTVAIVAAASCKPDFGERESLVTEARLLAVRAEPAESKAGDVVTYSALVVSAEGTIASPPVAWAFCATPKLLTENNVVSTACLRDGVRPVGLAPTVQAATPSDACALFGPETPPGDFRPRDPDETGGFFQPMRATYGAVVGFGLARITCNLANASGDVALDFSRRYVANRNPTLLPLGASVDGASRPFGEIPAGKSVSLRAAWKDGDAESYVVFDIATQAVVPRRESMRVSWFVSAGEFDSDRTGRTELEPESFTENVWHAPQAPGPVHLWVVLRDGRGGVAFASQEIVVIP